MFVLTPEMAEELEQFVYEHDELLAEVTVPGATVTEYLERLARVYVWNALEAKGWNVDWCLRLLGW